VIWFRHIKIAPIRRRVWVDYFRARRRGQKFNLVDERMSRLRPCKPGRLYTHPRIKKEVAIIQGRKTRLFKLTVLAILYKVDIKSVRNWYYSGWLPDGYITRQVRHNVAMPYYTGSQMRAIIRVLNDIFSQGIKKFVPARYMKHKEMLDKGNAIALARLERESKTKLRKEVGGAFGVAWVEE
jgi:hypothetical protein